jgi:glycogen debranching enzyme
MKVAMGLLAILATVGGIVLIPKTTTWLDTFLEPTFASAPAHHPSDGLIWFGLVLGAALGLLGIFVAYRIWGAANGEFAAALRERFARDFWVEEQGWYALARDGDGQQVRTLASNMGHLLWSGILDDDRAGRVADLLMAERLFSGWGVRTLATGQRAFNPLGYHLGTVWPHDNALIASGLARYGRQRDAERVAVAMIEAAGHLGHRLPEALSGIDRRAAHDHPVRYPSAASPQAWASGAVLQFVTVLLGLAPGRGTASRELATPDGSRRLTLDRTGTPGPRPVAVRDP